MTALHNSMHPIWQTLIPTKHLWPNTMPLQPLETPATNYQSTRRDTAEDVKLNTTTSTPGVAEWQTYGVSSP
jgi:hypothetical protein